MYKTFLLTAASGTILYQMGTVDGTTYYAYGIQATGTTVVINGITFTRSENVLTFVYNVY